MLAIELSTCIFDFAVTAAGRYPCLAARQSNPFMKILEWATPSAVYSWFGTLIWLAYPIFMLARILELDARVNGAPYPLVAQLYRPVWMLLAVPSALYLWHEAAQGWFIITAWREQLRKSARSEGAADNADAAPPPPRSTKGNEATSERAQCADVKQATPSDWFVCVQARASTPRRSSRCCATTLRRHAAPPKRSSETPRATCLNTTFFSRRRSSQRGCGRAVGSRCRVLVRRQVLRLRQLSTECRRSTGERVTQRLLAIRCLFFITHCVELRRSSNLGSRRCSAFAALTRLHCRWFERWRLGRAGEQRRSVLDQPLAGNLQ